MEKTVNDGGPQLTPNVLFSAICAVAAAIGPNCEAKMRRAVEAAAREDAAIPAAPAGLRDYFAGQALARIVAADEDGIMGPDITARACYRLADAMLAARGAA